MKPYSRKIFILVFEFLLIITNTNGDTTIDSAIANSTFMPFTNNSTTSFNDSTSETFLTMVNSTSTSTYFGTEFISTNALNSTNYSTSIDMITNLTTTTTITTTALGSTTTNITPSLSTTETTTTTGSPYNPNTCNSTDEVKLSNDSCVSKLDGAKIAVNILRHLNHTDSTIIAEALLLYFASIANLSVPLESTITLSPVEIDNFVHELDNITFVGDSKASFIIVQPPIQPNSTIVLGAAFRHNQGGQVIDNTNHYGIPYPNMSTAAIVSREPLTNVTSLNMLIIDDPTIYYTIDNSSNKTLASSVVVVAVRGNISTSVPTNISLYFQVLPHLIPPVSDVDYYCSSLDLYNSRWNQSSCTAPVNSSSFAGYLCNCSHLSSFALLWSPRSPTETTMVLSTSTTTTTTTSTPFNPDKCNDTNQISLTNRTCVSKLDGTEIAVNTLRNRTNTNSTVTAQALAIYFSSISGSNTSLTSNNILTLNEIDELVNNLTNITFTSNTTSSFIIAQPPIQGNNIIVLGASFIRNQGGNIVDNSSRHAINNSYISAAAIVSEQSLTDVTSLNMLIIDNPSIYRTIDNSSNKTLASSVIVASIRRNQYVVHPMNVSLYFQVLPDFKPNNTDVDYYCSFFDTLSSQWNESGCTTPIYNATYNRYECNCNHLTSFALIWLPKGPPSRYLDAQDIASLVFQSISILCFLAVITHALFIRLRDPLMSLQAYDLLPLISSASTTLLFIFYIALGMTVYTKTSSSNQTQCFTSSRVLMFIVYFFVIFMFCTKTSIGYFNYLRFVRLFPQPPHRKLFALLIISFFVSMTWVSFAIGFNSNSSFRITQLYAYKLCWFTRPALYYFLTIPVCIFLLINVILFILIVYRIINHVRYATSPYQTYERMKRCVLVLLSSCLSQGIGWLFGPVLSFVDPTAGEVLGWFFIIFNGLEGLWSILLYGTIRSQRMDEQKRVIAARELSKSTKISSGKHRKSVVDDGENFRTF